MNRRVFIKAGVAAGSIGAVADALAVPAGGQVSIVEASVAELQAAMKSGSLTSHALTAQYLARIAAFDKAGPKINAIIELNPDALTIEIGRAHV